jgi:hypothetical protein
VRSNPAFLRLLVIFVTNGVAAAIPATLLLFFVRDVLHAEEVTPVFLATYFLAGALGMPIWVVIARHIGLRLAWLAGMGLSVAGFAWALGLSSGDIWAFGAVCFVTGFALGADLAVPKAASDFFVDARRDERDGHPPDEDARAQIEGGDAVDRGAALGRDGPQGAVHQRDDADGDKLDRDLGAVGEHMREADAEGGGEGPHRGAPARARWAGAS